MRIISCIALIFLACTGALAGAPSVSVSLAGAGPTLIDASVTDPDGDLENSTLYIIDKGTGLVVWIDHRVLEGGSADISFVWPEHLWRATNGTHVVEPVMVVNTIGMAETVAPYTVYSAPCVLYYFPSGEEITAIAYFDAGGGLNLLTDLEDNPFYRSSALFETVMPGKFYPRYLRYNVSILADDASLEFFMRFSDGELGLHPPLILARSPIHGYGLWLEKVPVDARDFYVEVVAMDSQGGDGLDRVDLGEIQVRTPLSADVGSRSILEAWGPSAAS